jgi:hypothetical protein
MPGAYPYSTMTGGRVGPPQRRPGGSSTPNAPSHDTHPETPTLVNPHDTRDLDGLPDEEDF